jgi:hypothetical protein
MCYLLRCVGRDWHLTDKRFQPSNVRFWTRADKGGVTPGCGLSPFDPKRTSGPHHSILPCRPPKYTGLLLRRELRRRVLEHDIDLQRFGRDQEAAVSLLLANSGFYRRLTQRPFLDVVRMSATGDIP